jgi:hypothetical protein
MTEWLQPRPAVRAAEIKPSLGEPVFFIDTGKAVRSISKLREFRRKTLARKRKRKYSRSAGRDQIGLWLLILGWPVVLGPGQAPDDVGSAEGDATSWTKLTMA